MSDSPGKRSRIEWLELMDRYEAGNLTQRAFCTQNGLAYSSFCYWRKRLHTPSPAEAPALIELPMEAVDTTHPWRIEIDLGQGVVLRIR